MYTKSNYVQNIKEISFTNEYPKPNHFYSRTNITDFPNQYKIPIISRNDINYTQIYNMNSENYLSTPKLQEDNSFSLYMTPKNRNNANNRNIQIILYDYETQPCPTLTRINKYCYNNKVIVHKRSTNKNYNNNSIHFIKSVSKKKNEKENIENYNKKVIYINNKKIPTVYPKNYSNNSKNIINDINNYNLIRFDKNTKDRRKRNNICCNCDNSYTRDNINNKININNYIYPNNAKVTPKNNKSNYINDKNYIIIKPKDNQNNINYINNNNYNIPKRIIPNKPIQNNAQNTQEISNNTIINEINKKEEDNKKQLIEQLINEKKGLEKKLNEIIKENKLLKKNSLNNEDLMNKNKLLSEKLSKTENMVKQLQIENENYINEIDNHKNKENQNDIEINNINNKLKITYLKYLIEKKMIKEKKNLKSIFMRYKENSSNLKQNENENDGKNYKKFLEVVSTGIKNNDIYKQVEEDEEEKKKKEKEDEINKKNKILKDIINNKTKENNMIEQANFTKFYYKGLINEMKNQKDAIINPEQKKDDNNPNPIQDLPKSDENKTHDIQKQEKIEEPIKEVIPKEEEVPKEEVPKEEVPKEEVPKEEVPKEEVPKEEETQKKEPKKEEEPKQEEPKLTEEEIKKQEEERKKANKINQNRRKKLKKLLEDEKKQKLQLKRMYFKRFHFKALFFASNQQDENAMNLTEYLDEHLESRKTEEMRKKEEKEKEEQLQKEREELMQKRIEKLENIIYKKDRKAKIILKNNIEKWNIRTKLISLKEIQENDIKKNKGKSKKKSKKKKKDNNNSE